MLIFGCSGGSGSAPPAAPVTTTYYIDSVAGDDNNSGTSAATAWRSLARLDTAAFNGTTIVYLKRGGVWYESLTVLASSVMIDAYDSGAAPRIDGSIATTGWTNVGGGLYSKTLTLAAGEALGNLSENAVMLGFVAWQSDAPTSFAAAANGTFSFDNAARTLYIKPASNPAGNSYRASIRLRGIFADSLSDVQIRNVEITRASLNGIELKNCMRCSVENSAISRVGGAVIAANVAAPPDYLYAGNGIDFSNSSANGAVRNVTVSEVFDSCLAVETYLSNQHASAIEFTNAQLDRCGFAGVEISTLANQGASGSTIDSITVTGVQVTEAGQGWSGRRYGSEGHGLRIIADQGAGSMTNIAVLDAEVSGAAGDGIRLAGELGVVRLHRVNLRQNSGYGIYAADPSATTLRLDLSSTLIDRNGQYGLTFNAPAAAGLRVRHTTFYNNGAINLAIFGQSGIADLRNNLFHGSAPMAHLFVSSTLVSATVDHNCYNDTANMFGYNGATYSSVATFNTALGFEANGRGNGVVGLVDPANSDFRLLSNSDCRGLGDNGIGIADDYSGQPFSNPPASGAYEYR